MRIFLITILIIGLMLMITQFLQEYKNVVIISIGSLIVATSLMFLLNQDILLKQNSQNTVKEISIEEMIKKDQLANYSIIRKEKPMNVNIPKIRIDCKI